MLIFGTQGALAIPFTIFHSLNTLFTGFHLNIEPYQLLRYAFVSISTFFHYVHWYLHAAGTAVSTSELLLRVFLLPGQHFDPAGLVYHRGSSQSELQ